MRRETSAGRGFAGSACQPIWRRQPPFIQAALDGDIGAVPAQRVDGEYGFIFDDGVSFERLAEHDGDFLLVATYPTEIGEEALLANPPLAAPPAVRDGRYAVVEITLWYPAYLAAFEIFRLAPDVFAPIIKPR